MGDVVANMSMSLDGYIEEADGGVDPSFAWMYGSGETVVTVPGDEREYRTAETSAEHRRQAFGGTGALVNRAPAVRPDSRLEWRLGHSERHRRPRRHPASVPRPRHGLR